MFFKFAAKQVQSRYVGLLINIIPVKRDQPIPDKRAYICLTVFSFYIETVLGVVKNNFISLLNTLHILCVYILETKSHNPLRRRRP